MYQSRLQCEGDYQCYVTGKHRAWDNLEKDKRVNDRPNLLTLSKTSVSTISHLSEQALTIGYILT